MQGRTIATDAVPGTSGMTRKRWWRTASVVTVPLAAAALSACAGAPTTSAQSAAAIAPIEAAPAEAPESRGASARRTATAEERAAAAQVRAARKALIQAKRKAAAARAAARRAARAEARRAAQARRKAAREAARAAGLKPGRANPARPRTKPPVAPPAPKPGTGSGSTGTANLSSAEAEVLRLVNAERAKKEGCNPLVANSILNGVAAAHSKDMADKGYFSHTSQDGRSPFDRMKQAGYNGRMMGENIAAGQTTAAAVMKGWMNSPGHRANILNCGYREIGIGYHQGGSFRHYWTQNFGTR